MPEPEIVGRMAEYFAQLGEAISIVPKQTPRQEDAGGHPQGPSDELAFTLEDDEPEDAETDEEIRGMSQSALETKSDAKELRASENNMVMSTVPQDLKWKEIPQDAPVKTYQWPVHLAEGQLGIARWSLPLLYMYASQRYMELRQVHSVCSQADGAYPILDDMSICKDTLALTSVVLLVSPDHYSSWTGRKVAIRSILKTLESIQVLELRCQRITDVLKKELTFLNILFLKRPKVGEAWAHRRWLLGRFRDSIRLMVEAEDQREVLREMTLELVQIFVHEFDTCTDASNRHPRNYYAWSHAQWMITFLNHLENSLGPVDMAKSLLNLGDLYVRELQRVTNWNLNHVGDHCGYHHRIFILRQYFDLVDRSQTQYSQSFLVGFTALHHNLVRKLSRQTSPEAERSESSGDPDETPCEQSNQEVLRRWMGCLDDEAKDLTAFLVAAAKYDFSVPRRKSTDASIDRPKKRAHADADDTLEDDGMIRDQEEDKATRETRIIELCLKLPTCPNAKQLGAIMNALLPTAQMGVVGVGEVVEKEIRFLNELETMFPGHEALWMARRHLLDIFFERMSRFDRRLPSTIPPKAEALLGLSALTVSQLLWAWRAAQLAQERIRQTRIHALTFQRHILFHTVRLLRRFLSEASKDTQASLKSYELEGITQRLEFTYAALSRIILDVWPDRHQSL